MAAKARPAPSAAQAAVDEATGDTGPFQVQFRGQTFDVDRDIVNDARFRLALASMQDHQIVYEALGPVNAGRFLTLIVRGERMPDVAREFIEALNAAAGWGNS